MGKNSKLLATITAIAVWLAASFTAHGHQTSMGRFWIKILTKNREVILLLSVSRDDIGTFLKLDKNGDQKISSSELDGNRWKIERYISSRLDVVNNWRRCQLKEQKFLERQESFTKGRVLFFQKWRCEGELKKLLIKNRVLFEDVGGYRHLAQVSIGDRVVRTALFHRLAPELSLELEPPKSTEKEANSPAKSVSSEFISTAVQFIWQGMLHIWEGLDHLAFLLCLLVVSYRMRELLMVVTAFTVGHSITLILSAMGMLQLPVKLVETSIAASISFVALENLLKRDSFPKNRALVAGLFGFIHGFGFAFSLRELNLPSKYFITSLFSFNIGVEIGQILIIILTYPLLKILMKGSKYRLFLDVVNGAVLAVSIYWIAVRISS